MTTALIYFGASMIMVILLGTLYIIEDRHGDRVVLSGLRSFLDRSFYFLIRRAYRIVMVVWHSLVRFVLRHGVYRMLGAVLNYLIKLEKQVEDVIFRHHRPQVRENRERTHLDEIADHKESTALSDEEKQRLRDE